MHHRDALECARVFDVSLNASRAARGLPAQAFTAVEETIQHLLATDPQGSFVASDGDGPIVGFAQAARRERLWLLGSLFVLPTAQGLGIGKELLRAAFDYGSGLRDGIICSTADPRAFALYGRLPGFELHPTLTARGVVQLERIADTPSVRPGKVSDLEFAARIDRLVRFGSHGPDFRHLLKHGCSLFVNPRGYAVADTSGPRIIAAFDSGGGAELLRACLRACGDGSVAQIARIGADQQWAIQVALEGGLALASGGALAVRNNQIARAAYVPDNIFC